MLHDSQTENGSLAKVILEEFDSLVLWFKSQGDDNDVAEYKAKHFQKEKYS